MLDGLELLAFFDMPFDTTFFSHKVMSSGVKNHSRAVKLPKDLVKEGYSCHYTL